MSTISWHWRLGRAGYAAHLGRCTAWIQFETTVGPGGESRPIAGAASATRFRVAILSPAGIERYCLRGTLDTARSKLAAALARRAAAPVPPPAAATALDWRIDGPWYAPFRASGP